MALFSQRIGIRPLEKVFQHESMDDELRNSLWNVLQINVWNIGWRTQWMMAFVKKIWFYYFKKPIDEIIYRIGSDYSADKIIRVHFFNRKWWEIFDFIEFIINNIDKTTSDKIKLECNHFLELENSAYRIVNNEIVEITDKHEIKTIEDALDSKIQPIKLHLTQALEHLSDRASPDYRNSIKESISAVEAACRTITGNDKATLGEAIKRIGDNIHPALEKAFLLLYGYTNDAGGLRHALTEHSTSPRYSDAKLMLVLCSAFINFLLARTSENNPKI
jgi:hypothetical protein